MSRCADGYWSLSGSITCNPCMQGFYCPNNGSLPIPCPSGTYRYLPNDLSCIACPGGSSCEDPGVAPKLCPEGI